MLSFGDTDADALLAALLGSERLSAWHLVHPDGRYSSRAAAGIDWLEVLGHPRAAATLARVHDPAERLYTLIAGHRDALGRLVPDGPAPRRFP